jgi:HEPN domain-containing protein
MSPIHFGGIIDQKDASKNRREDAVALQAEKRWRGAMYMMGYAIECALKAKLMELFGERTLSALQQRLRVKRGEPDLDLKTHSIDRLISLLPEAERVRKQLTAPDMRSHYTLCTTWTTDWRYTPDPANRIDCDEFLKAGVRILEFIERNT